MSDELLVTDEAILNTAKLYKETYELLEEDAKKILDMAGLLEGAWKGDACDKFIDSVPKMLEDFKSSGEMIKEMSEELYNYAENMASVDKEQASLWDEITDAWNSFWGNDLESSDISADDWDVGEFKENTDNDIVEENKNFYETLISALTTGNPNDVLNAIHFLSGPLLPVTMKIFNLPGLNILRGTGFVTGLMLDGYRAIKKMNNYDNNIKIWNEEKKEILSKDNFIENQNDLKDMEIGMTTADDMSCEIVATYNAFNDLERKGGSKATEFPELIKEFEDKNALSLGGYFGSDPYKINEIIQNHGYKTDFKTASQLKTSKAYQELQNNYDTYILTAMNEKGNVKSMVHTISITKRNGKYVMHNAGDFNKNEYDSLEDAVKNYGVERDKKGNIINESDPMCIIGVKES